VPKTNDVSAAPAARTQEELWGRPTCSRSAVLPGWQWPQAKALCGSLLFWSPFLSFPYTRGPLLGGRQCNWPPVPRVKLAHSRRPRRARAPSRALGRPWDLEGLGRPWDLEGSSSPQIRAYR
jgi:hypothetical protein